MGKTAFGFLLAFNFNTTKAKDPLMVRKIAMRLLHGILPALGGEAGDKQEKGRVGGVDQERKVRNACGFKKISAGYDGRACWLCCINR